MEDEMDGWMDRYRNTEWEKEIEGRTEGCLVEEMDGWRMRWMDREMENEMDPQLASHERPLRGSSVLNTPWEKAAEPHYIFSTDQEWAGGGPTKLVMSKPRGRAQLRQQCMGSIRLAEVFLPPACSL